MSVLVVEDNVVNQRLAVRLLEKRGHTVTVAGNGIEALEALERSRYDAILMDLQMPRMGGLEATAEIRRLEEGSTRHQPIIAMTAHAMKGDREQCLEAGMDAYLSKPIQSDELYRTLESFAPHSDQNQRRAVSETKALQSSSKSVTAKHESIPSQELVDWSAAIKAAAGDRELVGELISIFLETLPLWLSEIHKALGSSDAALLQRIAHSLKGSLGQLGANAARELAQKLETQAAAKELVAAAKTLPQLQSALDQVCPVLSAQRESLGPA